MARASKKHLGAGSQGKGTGSGGMAKTPDVPENTVLSNRDKAGHTDDRGRDGKWIQSEQLHDNELNQVKK